MTREEAIAWFENWLLDYYDIDDIPQDLTAELAGIALASLRQQEQLDKVSQGSSQDKPLTLDELRKMDGEPVYCVEITGREEWLFRRDGGFADMYGEFTSDDFMVFDNYGKLWWCYRQKPEEGTV